MAVDLTLAGVFQGYYWGSLEPWDVSVDGSMPFWILRVFAGLAMLAGQVCFLYNIYRTWLLSQAAPVAVQPAVPPVIEVSPQAAHHSLQNVSC